MVLWSDDTQTDTILIPTVKAAGGSITLKFTLGPLYPEL